MNGQTAEVVMKPTLTRCSMLAGGTILLLLTSCFPLFGGWQSGQVKIQAVQGEVLYSLNDAAWQRLSAPCSLSAGAVIKTGRYATVDLLLQYNGSSLRLLPQSTLRLEKLNRQSTGEQCITDTRLKLEAGALVGLQRKLAKPSHLDVVTPEGLTTIVGTEYVVRADGAVTVLSGTVTVNFNLPGNGGSVKVTVSAGYSFDPATGQVVPTSPAYLQDLVAHIDTVRQNAEVFKVGGATVVVKPEEELSPVKGNNGVGNGVDPQPPGNPPINDGPGTGPGNPGNKGGP